MSHVASSLTRRAAALGVLLVALALAPGLPARAEADFPPAPIVNDEGGPVEVNGQMTYSNPDFFLRGLAQPLVLLEDQAGFVDRNLYFHFPPESQTLGQFTSDWRESPVQYSLALPLEPQGSYRDVDYDGEEDRGVQIFAVAFWSNMFGDPFLEERDMMGGGWSGAYATTEISEDADTYMEIVGGEYIVYAPDDQQGFPLDFGADEKLFTGDEPMVRLPAGYTVVDMDTRPFTFRRERVANLDLREPEGAVLADYSGMRFTEAFEALVAKMRQEYAFTELKGIDWDARLAEFRPRFERADSERDPALYFYALRDFILSIPDGHLNAPFSRQDYLMATESGIGLALTELDDGRIVASYVTANSPAARAGIVLGAEIQAINGNPVEERLAATVPYEGPFSAAHVERLQKLRYAMRFPVGEKVSVTFQNPDTTSPQTAHLRAEPERESFRASSPYGDTTGLELPVEFELTPEGYGVVHIYSLSDNELLTVQLWERVMTTMNQYGLPGLIVDMRQNSGGSGFLTDQLAAYFFNESLVASRSATYDKKSGEFVSDPRGDSRLYLPSDDLRYHGPVVVLIGPNCFSACEYFSYSMTLQDRATLIGQYPTGGLGGGITSGTNVLMPQGIQLQFPGSRPLAADSDEIIIEGEGIAPDIRVPVTEETLFSAGDPVLEAAIDHLNQIGG